MKLDFDKISADFMKALRGSQSQRALARRLGYATNVVYLWENGRRAPQTTQVFDVIRLVAEDADAEHIEGIDSVEALSTYLRSFLRTENINQLAEALGKSRHVVSRWLRGKSEPKFPEFLAFLETVSRRALDWIARFVDPDLLAAAQPSWRALQKVRAIGATQPFAMAIINAVELVDYCALPEHEEGWIAKRMGCSVEEEISILESLKDASVVGWNGTHYEVNVEFIDLVLVPVRYWVQLALDRESKRRFFVAAVSEGKYQEILEASTLFWRDITEMLVDDENPDRVMVFTNQVSVLDKDP